jgi:hypothetical protein
MTAKATPPAAKAPLTTKRGFLNSEERFPIFVTREVIIGQLDPAHGDTGEDVVVAAFRLIGEDVAVSDARNDGSEFRSLSYRVRDLGLSLAVEFDK